MAAYHRVDGLVTLGLTACTPGSAPGPAVGSESGRTFTSSILKLFQFFWLHYKEEVALCYTRDFFLVLVDCGLAD